MLFDRSSMHNRKRYARWIFLKLNNFFNILKLRYFI
jgi:hypothetical protein